MFFIGSSVYIVYAMRQKYMASYDKDLDVWRKRFLIIPCAILAIFFPEQYSLMEILWTFSIFLEAVAIMPQFFLLIKKGKAESVTRDYMAALGGYRAFYVLNWIWRYFTEGFFHYQVFIAGIVQTALYGEFLWKYVRYDLAKRYELVH
mmetsp:Transcript_864/g.2955  ORF Transcript_864/g.2955 Transcript_864/m.2955 type:complete len:148 (-) Transcript_864:786-1229(-)